MSPEICHKAPTPPAISQKEIAQLIVSKNGFTNAGGTRKSLLASGGIAWSCQDDELTEVPWSEYERAFNDEARRDWPPYTITFEVSGLCDDQTLKVDVITDYDMGVTENSRGGNNSTWRLKYQDGGWRVVEIEFTMFWD